MLIRVVRKVMLIAACLCIFCLQLPAQSSYGSIVGTVTDPSGAIIPGAAITLTNLDTSEIFKTVSNAGGNYQFVNLQPGDYKVDVTVRGFKHLTRNQVQVAVQLATRIDAVMQVGEVDQQEGAGQGVGPPSAAGGDEGAGGHTRRPVQKLMTWVISSDHCLRKRRMRMRGRNMRKGWRL